MKHIDPRGDARSWWRGAAFLIGFLGMLASATPASAQLFGVGGNPAVVSTEVRGTDTAFDPVNNVYLVVGSTDGGGQPPLWGVFVDGSGNPVQAPFIINDCCVAAAFPRVIYSPHVSNGAGGSGGFLVTWPGGAFTKTMKTRIVAYPNRLVSPERTLPERAHNEVGGRGIAYSTASQVFLIVWRDAVPTTIWGARIGLDGSPIGSSFLIAYEPGGGFQSTSAAWNPASNEFGVTSSGWGPQGTVTTFSRVSASGTLLSHSAFNFGGATGIFITDTAVNPATGRYIVGWFQGGIQGAEIGPGGDIVAKGLISTTTGTTDGLSISYNPVSGTFLMVGQGQSYDVFGTELNSRGARTASDGIITSAGAPGSFHPRAGARTNAPHWNVSFQHGFSIKNKVIGTSSTGGGPAGSLGAVSSPPPTGGSTGCPGTAPFPDAVCVNGGWVPGTGGGGGSSGGCPGTAPFPGAVCVNGGWVPGSTGGGGTSTGGCPGTAPFPGAVCVNGGWVPGSTGGGGTSTGGCPGTAPFPGAECVNGGWVPGTGGGGGSTGGCPGTAPFPGAVCVNGGWIPGNTGGSTGSCPGTAPFPGAVCVNGGWIPGNTGSSGGCSTPDPFVAIGGGTCVNGGWIPGGSSSTGGCPGATPPFAGAVCVNGGWIPGSPGGSSSGGCLTSSPGAGWTCVNGGWLPPGSGGSSASSCSTSPPGSGWVCINGGWLPPTMVSSGGCTTPDPFAAIGGGICINGGWIPRGM